jgi:hypothetical protein
MSEPNKTKPYFAVNFGEQGGLYEWKTHEEVVNWISQLQNQWAWLSGLGHQSTQNVWQTIYTNLNSITSILQQSINFRSQNNLPNADSYLATAQTSLENFIRPYPWLLQNSAQRRFIEDVRETRHPLEAGLIVASWMNQDLNGAPFRYAVSALLQSELYERGIKDRMKTESATLKKLAGDMQSTLTQYQEAERAQTNRFENLHSGLTSQQSAQQTTFEESQLKRTDAWELQRNTAQSELDNIKNTYDQHMAIAAPVDYWEAKRTKHRNLTLISGVAFIIGVGSVGLFLSSKMQSISAALKLATSNPQPVAASANQAASSVQAASQMPVTVSSAITTWEIATFVMVAVLCFWILRLLVRIFLSNMHLENDAAERVTMAKTYLALIRSDGLSKEGNIDAVLAALFRPTGDGIVKDEGLPPSMMEFLTKLK